jgi:biopolymer transport protein TolQ
MNEPILANLVTLATSNEGDLHPLQLILEASFVVQFVMLILTFMGIGSFIIIGMKVVRFSKARRVSQEFLDAFWAGEDGARWTTTRLEEVYAKLHQFEDSPLAAQFRAGYVELARVLGEGGSGREAEGDTESVERAMRRAARNEVTRLETLLPFLSTTGATAPFIGLFGTVWGIMQSFISIHGSGSASLDVVAPGIAEALIATAMGLVAAIPAVMAFNYAVRFLRVIESEIESFGYDFLNIVRRSFLRG